MLNIVYFDDQSAGELVSIVRSLDPRAKESMLLVQLTFRHVGQVYSIQHVPNTLSMATIVVTIVSFY